MVLVLVLILIALLSFSGYTFSELMFSEYKAADLTLRQAQARAAAESGIESARVFLAQDAETQQQTGGWYDNPTQFHGMAVNDDTRASRRGRFTVIAPRLRGGRQDGVRHGLENESAKLSLALVLQVDQAAKNSSATSTGATSTSTTASSSGTSTENPGRKMLMALPGMTEDVADAILDWMDSDSETRELGAEADYYGSLDPAYAPRNGLPKTIEELLRVRGVTPALLFGADANRNGVIDNNESANNLLQGSQNTDDASACGWAAYLTLNSAESTAKADGQAKINLNQSDMQQLYNDLQQVFDADHAKFIVAGRQYTISTTSATATAGGTRSDTSQDTDSAMSKEKVATIGGDDQKNQQGQSGTKSSQESSASSGSSTTGTISSLQLDFTAQGNSKLATVLDVVGATVTANNVKYNSPFTEDDKETITKLLENTTVATGTSIPARININQAPRAVLAAVPGMTDELLESISAMRQEDPSNPTVEQQNEAWPYTEGLMDLATLRSMLPYITTAGSVFRGTVVGYFDGGGPAARVEVVLDATVRPARVLFWREVSQLGRGYSLSDLGAQAASAASSSPSSDAESEPQISPPGMP
jgi:DNA uptake protein ComE-like DNA-binding protein